MLKRLIALALVGASTSALAQTPALYGWETPDPYTQLDRDRSILPDGMGGVFVPSLSAAGDEPSIYIVSPEQVYTGSTGRKIAIPPGRYVVLVGSSDPRQSAKTPIEVMEGQTTLVPVNYGGLRLDIVDKRLRPAENVLLELVQEETGEAVAAWPELGDDPGTRLLKPGAYRIQKPGSDGVSAPDFATVWVPEGGLVHLRVFVDNQGQLLGAGVVPKEEVDDRPGNEERWRRSIVVGADGALSQYQSVIGRPDLTVANGSAFIDASMAYVGDPHLVEVDASLEEGVMLVQPSTGAPLPLIKSTDKLQLDARYTVLLNEGVGFYAHLGGETQLFPWDAVAAQDATIVFQNTDGTVDRLNVTGGQTYRLAEALSPIMMRGGTGLRVRFSTLRDLDLSLYGGAGFRSYKLAGTYMPVDDPDTPEVEYLQLSDIDRLGVEGGLTATVRLTNFLTYRTRLSVFTDPTDPMDYIGAWDNDLSVALTRNFSVHYRAHFDQIRAISTKPQIDQGIFVRASWNVL